jgi:hypothetical protein
MYCGNASASMSLAADVVSAVAKLSLIGMVTNCGSDSTLSKGMSIGQRRARSKSRPVREGRRAPMSLRPIVRGMEQLARPPCVPRAERACIAEHHPSLIVQNRDPGADCDRTGIKTLLASSKVAAVVLRLEPVPASVWLRARSMSRGRSTFAKAQQRFTLLLCTTALAHKNHSICAQPRTNNGRRR